MKGPPMKKTAEAKTEKSRDKVLKQSMTTRLLLVAIVEALAAPIATPDDGAVLVQNHKCGMCNSHGVGPTVQAISAKYAGKADATATVAAVIKNGAQGMPPTAVSGAEARTITSYIRAHGR